MNRHWRYLKTVAKHKYFVFRAGLWTGAPLWRLIIHDWSKFTPAEWGPYVRRFQGGRAGKLDHEADKQEFRYAFLHHLHRNPHHWEHWVLKQPQPMPAHFIREMVADWCGAGRAYTGRWDISEWYEANKGRMDLHPDTRQHVEACLLSLTKRRLK